MIKGLDQKGRPMKVAARLKIEEKGGWMSALGRKLALLESLASFPARLPSPPPPVNPHTLGLTLVLPRAF